MLIYVGLSSDCCGEVFEGLFNTLEDAQEAVKNSPRPEAVEEWEVRIPAIRVRRWDWKFDAGWVEAALRNS